MPALLIVAAAVAAASGSPARAPAASDSFEIAQLTVRSHVTIRVRSMPAQLPPMLELREKKGPHCLPMGSIVGAAVIAQNSVDLILRGGARVRAKFENSCPALDYYSGFYLKPGPDGQICADRDAVHSRAGGECAIDKFRTLVVKHADR
jgi:hypothetical protein